MLPLAGGWLEALLLDCDIERMIQIFSIYGDWICFVIHMWALFAMQTYFIYTRIVKCAISLKCISPMSTSVIAEHLVSGLFLPKAPLLSVLGLMLLPVEGFYCGFFLHYDLVRPLLISQCHGSLGLKECSESFTQLRCSTVR